MPDDPAVEAPEVDLDLPFRTSAVDDTFLDDPSQPFADLFAARTGRDAEPPGDSLREESPGTGSPASDPAAASPDEAPAPGVDAAAEGLSADQQRELDAWLRRMQQIPAERVQALDYFLATGELPASLAPAPQRAPEPTPPPADPLAQIDFRALEDNVGAETADAIRALAERARTQDAELARAQAMQAEQARIALEAQQRAQLDMISQTTAEFAASHGFDEQTMSAIVDRTAELGVIPGLVAAGHDPRTALTRALELAVRDDQQWLDRYIDERVNERVAAASAAQSQRAERKQLATQVAGTAGTAPRTVAPLTGDQL